MPAAIVLTSSAMPANRHRTFEAAGCWTWYSAGLNLLLTCVEGSSANGGNHCGCRSVTPSRIPAPLAGAEPFISGGPVHTHRLALVRFAVDRLWCGGGLRHP